MKSLRTKILVPIIILGLLGIAIAACSTLMSMKMRNQTDEVNREHQRLEALLENKTWMEKNQKLLLASSTIPSFLTDARAGCLAAVDIVREETHNTADKFRENCSDDEIATADELEALMAPVEEISITVQNYLAAANDEPANDILGGGQMEEICGPYDDFIEATVAVINEDIASVKDEQSSIVTQMIIVDVVLALIGLACVIVAVIIGTVRVLKPIIKAKNDLEKITKSIDDNEGNLSTRIEYKSNDEIKALVNGINSFLDTLETLISNIRGNADGLFNTTSTMALNIKTTDGNAVNISAAMEELSATMEEVSSTVSVVTENTHSISSNTEELESETVVMSKYSDEMATRANELKKTAQQNKAAAEVLVQEILSTLKEAIENSKNVEQINSLTDEILSISSQTNLLALNASIEAARAGEAGKGFAVVADEIRVLADNSRNTANNIQAINSQVVEAVTALSGDSKRLIEFIDENVLPDYDLLVNSGIQYSEDSDYISNGMNAFANKTKEIQAMISEMNESIERINAAVEDGALGVSNAAADTAQLVNEISSIGEETRINQEITERLTAETNRFIDASVEEVEE